MCGRYYCDEDILYSIHDVGVEENKEIETGDFFPSETIPVILYKDKKLMIEEMSWGYSTSQALVINARSETLLEKSMFQNDALNHRCLIIAKGFYEWDAHKHKISFESSQDRCLYIAGIYRGDKKEVVIITTKANQVMKPVHSRMPLFIRARDREEWLLNRDRLEEFLESSFEDLVIVSGNIQQALF